MGVQIVGFVWCSSDIIFGSCCDGDLCIFQVKCVPFSPMMENLEAEKYHNKVLQLDVLKVWHHSQLVLVIGSEVLLPILFIPMIMFFIAVVKL